MKVNDSEMSMSWNNEAWSIPEISVLRYSLYRYWWLYTLHIAVFVAYSSFSFTPTRVAIRNSMFSCLHAEIFTFSSSTSRILPPSWVSNYRLRRTVSNGSTEWYGSGNYVAIICFHFHFRLMAAIFDFSLRCKVGLLESVVLFCWIQWIHSTAKCSFLSSIFPGYIFNTAISTSVL